MSEQVIYDQLAAITALDGRVYPKVLPQDVQYPAATYQRISTTRYHAFGRDAEPVEPTIQVDVYDLHSKGQASFDVLTTAVRRALQRQSSGDGIDNFLDAERDDYEENTRLDRKSRTTCVPGIGRRRDDQASA